MDRLKHVAIPSVITGAVVGLGSQYVLDYGGMNVRLPGGFVVSAPVAYGILGATSKVVNSFTSEFILPAISHDGSLLGIAGMASPAITGSILVGADMFVNGKPSIMDGAKLFGLGVVGDIAGEWAGDRMRQF